MNLQRKWIAAILATLSLSVMAPLTASAQTERVAPDSNGQMELSFAPIVKRVAPSVVNVYATTVTAATASPFAGDPFFQRFFGGNSQFFGSRPRTSQSLGSGVIVDSSGLILTNSHVVNGATDIRVTLTDGHEYAVELVLNDPKTDMAALRIKDPGGRSFPALTFGNSDNLEVGDLVLAIGNPFGVGQTVTSGIVSALARTGVEASDYSFFIQTDAAINPGNSGGALVDMQGRLIGINSAIFSQSGGSVGIGFAIPVNMAKVIVDTAIKGGQVVRPWFGARLQDLTTDLAKSLGLDVPRGALIADIAANSPAADAGFKSGDVIISVDGQAVRDSHAFNFRMATKPVGSSVPIEIVRQGKKMVLETPLRAAPSDNPALQVKITADTVFSGITAAALSPSLAQEFSLPFDSKGVVVLDVAKGSRADNVGFQSGDVLLNINGTAIQTKDDFSRIASTASRGWQLVLQRGGQIIRSFVSG